MTIKTFGTVFKEEERIIVRRRGTLLLLLVLTLLAILFSSPVGVAQRKINPRGITGKFYAGPGGSPTIAEATVSALAAGGGIVEIAPNYTGTECPSSVHANITFMDYRPLGSETCTQNSVSWNQLSGSGLHTMARFIQTRSSPTNSDLALYGQSFVSGTLPNNQNLDGVSGEVDLNGALTTPANLNVIGLEGSVNFSGPTGGTIPFVAGIEGNAGSTSGTTTNITTYAAVHGVAYNKGGSETVTTAYSVKADEQAAGLLRNYALAGFGFNLLGYGSSADAAGLDAEDSFHTIHRFIVIDSSGNTIIQAIGSQGISLTSSDGTGRALVNSSGLGSVVALFPTVAANHPIGTAALPYSGIHIGTAASNDFFFSPAATSAERTINIADPGATSTLPLCFNTTNCQIQSKRSVSGCTTSGGALAFTGPCAVAVTWPTAFADAKYTVACVGNGIGAGVPILQGVTNKIAASVTVQTQQATGTNASFSTIECVATHD